MSSAAGRLLLFPRFSGMTYCRIRQLSYVCVTRKPDPTKHSAKARIGYQRIRQLCASSSKLHNGGVGKVSILHSRGLIELSGRDSAKLLQGLITNDMNSLLPTTTTDDDDANASAGDGCAGVIHSHVLSVQGRILYDVFVYSTPEENTFLVECDRSACENLIAYFKKYKLRSKVSFRQRPDLKVLALFPSSSRDQRNYKTLKELGQHLLSERLQVADNNVLAFTPDPRLNLLGFRCVATVGMDSTSLLTDDLRKMFTRRSSGEYDNNGDSLDVVEENCYHQYRYTLGIAEGCGEMENGIPLEYNGALLNSVSFQKGCYVGQELVARAHFTGVIRKRVLPIQILTTETSGREASKDSSVTGQEIAPGASVYIAKGKKAGKVLAVNSSGYGVGLMRLKDCLPAKTSSSSTATISSSDESDKELFVVDSQQKKIEINVRRPSWWPEDLQY